MRCGRVWARTINPETDAVKATSGTQHAHQWTLPSHTSRDRSRPPSSVAQRTAAAAAAREETHLVFLLRSTPRCCRQGGPRSASQSPVRVTSRRGFWDWRRPDGTIQRRAAETPARCLLPNRAPLAPPRRRLGTARPSRPVAGVNLIALAMMFQTTCRSRAASPMTTIGAGRSSSRSSTLSLQPLPAPCRPFPGEACADQRVLAPTGAGPRRCATHRGGRPRGGLARVRLCSMARMPVWIVSASKGPPLSIVAHPRSAVSGVWSSCESTARKLVLCPTGGLCLLKQPRVLDRVAQAASELLGQLQITFVECPAGGNDQQRTDRPAARRKRSNDV